MSAKSGEMLPLDRQAFSSDILRKPHNAHAFIVSTGIQCPKSTISPRTFCGRFQKLVFARGALLAKGPDSSLGEVHRKSCSEDIHMEESQFKRTKWKMGETNEECEARVEERSNTQAHDTWMG